MTDYVGSLQAEGFAPYKRCAQRIVDEAETSCYVVDGVLRWNSNNRVPFDDVLAVFLYIGKVFDLKKSRAARTVDTDELIARYREVNANRVMGDEERFEARAAFGEGAQIVDIITGQKFTV
jgi:hypothetical protein